MLRAEVLWNLVAILVDWAKTDYFFLPSAAELACGCLAFAALACACFALAALAAACSLACGAVRAEEGRKKE